MSLLILWFLGNVTGYNCGFTYGFLLTLHGTAIDLYRNYSIQQQVLTDIIWYNNRSLLTLYGTTTVPY